MPTVERGDSTDEDQNDQRDNVGGDGDHDDSAHEHPIDNEDEAERRQIAIRVKEWHEHLRPVLKKCKERSDFDIHALGSDIINIFPEDEPYKQITYADVMKNRDHADNARYFLSLLLLTNTKNVHIERTNPELNGKVICRKEELNIRLVSRARHLDSVNNIDKHLDRNRISSTAPPDMNEPVAGPSHAPY